MKSKVAVVNVQAQGMEYSIYNSVKEAIVLIGGVDSFCKPGKRVLIKPNITNPSPMDATNPVVTWAVAKIFSEHGCEVLLGEDPAIPTNEKTAYKEYGLYEIGKSSGAKVVSLRSGGHVMKKVPIDGYFSEIEVSKYAVEADLVISVPTMKSANITAVTLGMKNMKGIISPDWKRKFHTEGLNQGVVDLNAAVTPGLVIIDATFGKDMPRKLCYPVGLIIAGKDPVATDSVCTRIMGMKPEEVDHIALAHKAGLGNMDQNDIDVVGVDLDKFIQNLKERFVFSKPKNPFKIAEESNGKVKIVQGNPCSVCLNELGNSLSLRREQLKDMDETVIFIGPNADPSAYPNNINKIYYGQCLKAHRDESYYLKGCPPTEDAWIAEKNGSLKNMLDELLDKSACEQEKV